MTGIQGTNIGVRVQVSKDVQFRYGDTTLLGIRFMQENGSAHNRDIGSAGGGIVDRQIELLRWFGIKGDDSRTILSTLIADIESVTDSFIRGKVGKHIRALSIGCHTRQVFSSITLGYL